MQKRLMGQVIFPLSGLRRRSTWGLRYWEVSLYILTSISHLLKYLAQFIKNVQYS